MANRYWVGGTATWDATAGTKWGTASGGAGGAAVPTAADDVYFDAVSSGTVTLSSSTVARSINCTGFTGTISHPAAATIAIGDGTAGAGNVALLLVAGMTYTLGNAATSAINFLSTSATQQTIATGGKTLGSWTINGVGSSYLLSDTNTVGATATVTLTAGTLNTNNQTCSWGKFNSSNTNTRGLTLGTSTLTMTVASGSAWDVITKTNLTLSASSSTIILANGSFFQTASSTTWGSVTFDRGSGQLLATSCTFTNLSCIGAANKFNDLAISGSNIVTGTLTITGNSAVNRCYIRTFTTGAQRTLTATVTSLVNVDFIDIAGAGASAPWTGTSIGDCLGNSNITFTAPATQTWQGTSGGNWSDAAKWTSRVPLPQDNVVIASAFSAPQTITGDMPRLGTDINFTGSTGSPTWTVSATATMYGSLNLTGVGTVGGSTTFTFAGRSSHTITSAGKSMALWGNIAGPGATYSLQDALQMNNLVTAAAGLTFETNSHNVTIANYQINNGTTVNMGTGTWTLNGALASPSSIWNVTGTGAVVNASNSTIIISTALTNGRIFTGAGKTYGTLTYTVANSPGDLTIAGANTFGTLDIGSGRILTMPSSTTTTISNSFNANGVSNPYLYLPGSGANNVTTPSSAALNITGDIDLRARVALDDWTPSSPQCIITKWSSSYAFRVTTGGALQLFLTPDNGPTQLFATSSVLPSVSDGQTLWIRATWRASDGRVQFFTASGALTSPNAGDFTQLGSDGTVNIGAMSYNAGTVVQLSGFSGSQPMAGKAYRVQIYNGIDGTLALDADLTTKAFGADSFAESSVNAATVTINGTLAQAGDGRVLINSSSSGVSATLSKSSGTVSSNYLTIKDSAAGGGATWYAGVNSVNVSGNSGWIFTGTSSNFLQMF